MTDPNMTDFYGRVARIQKARAKGHGFEAAGALGRSFYNRPKSRRRSLLVPVTVLVLGCFVLKGIIYHSVGAQTYDDRVAVLMAGKGVEPVGGWIMQPEPVTRFVADQITNGLAKLK